MASIIKRRASKYYCAVYRDKKGRQRFISTKLTDQGKALRLAQAWELGEQRKRTVEYLREVTENIIREWLLENDTGRELERISVAKYAQDWLARKQPEWSRVSYEIYQKSAAKFLRFLGDAAEDDIGSITRKTIAAFRAHVGSEVSARTANFDLQAIKAIFKAARSDRHIADDPTEGVGYIKRQECQVSRRPFTMDEVRSVLAAASPEWQSLIIFGLYTGQRLGDLASLTWGNVDLQRNLIRLETRKTGKSLRIPIAPFLKDHILTLPAAASINAPLHPRAYKGVTNGRRETSGLSKEFGRLLIDAGLREPREHPRDGSPRGVRRKLSELSFHCLRHNAVSLMKEAGVPHAVVMELIGHDSDAVSAQYTHIGDEALQKAAAALPGL
jgi:integrase